MKKQILSIALAFGLLTTASVAHAAGNDNSKQTTTQQKIVKNFQDQFAQVPTISMAENGFIASSVVDGHQVTAAYNKNGKNVYSVVRYGADNLDKNILGIVSDSYRKYYVSSMEKVTQPGFDPVFIVHLSNDQSSKVVRVSNLGTDLLLDLVKM